MRARYRLAVIVIAGLLTFGLGVHHGATFDTNWPHPTGDQLADDIDGWDGEDVLLIGEVTMVIPEEEAIVIEIDDSHDQIVAVVEVEGVAPDIEEGGVIQVYGELDEEASVLAADAVVVVNRGPSDEHYKLGMSILGVLVAIGLFLRHWRIEWRSLRFVHRWGELDG